MNLIRVFKFSLKVDVSFVRLVGFKGKDFEFI